MGEAGSCWPGVTGGGWPVRTYVATHRELDPGIYVINPAICIVIIKKFILLFYKALSE